MPAGVLSGWVLKLGLQWAALGRGLGLNAQRQAKEPEVWSGPLVGWSVGPPWEPHCQRVKRGVWGCPSSLTVSALTAGHGSSCCRHWECAITSSVWEHACTTGGTSKPITGASAVETGPLPAAVGFVGAHTQVEVGLKSNPITGAPTAGVGA